MPHKSLCSPISTFYPYSEKNYTPTNTNAIIYDLFRLIVFFFNVYQQRYTRQFCSEGAQAVGHPLYPLCSRATVRSSVSNTAGDTPAAALRPAEWSAQNTAWSITDRADALPHADLHVSQEYCALSLSFVDTDV